MGEQYGFWLVGADPDGKLNGICHDAEHGRTYMMNAHGDATAKDLLEEEINQSIDPQEPREENEA